MTTALLTATYFGPVQWYQKLNRHPRCLVEQWDSFIKQTYRNRCVIATTNGPQTLTVPVERGSDATMRQARVSDHANWRHQHWQALQSAYGDSPFFVYYADDLRPFFEQRWDRLLDFDMAITRKMCELLDIAPCLQLTREFLPPAPAGAQAPAAQGLSDFREAIRPKHPCPDPDFQPRPYYQVYARKHGFLPNLSILDLLFNMGPEAVLYL